MSWPRLAARFVTRPSAATRPLDCTASLAGLTGLTGLTVCLSVMLSPHTGSGVVRMGEGCGHACEMDVRHEA
jgi:hypothetical protein